MAEPAHESGTSFRAPVVPLRGAVVLPLTVAPLGVSRPMSVEAVNRALAGDRLVLLLLQKNEADEPGPDDLHRVGTVGVIRQMAKAPSGMRVLVEGRGAGARRVPAATTPASCRRCSSRCPESSERTIEIDAHVRRLQELVDRALSLATGLSPDIKALVTSIDDPLRLAYLLASLLDMKAEDKQKLLEENSLDVKLDAVAMALVARDRGARAEGPDRVAAEKEMTDAQRAVPAAPAAQGDPDRARRRAKARPASSARGSPRRTCRKRSTTVALREVDRLERMTPASPEYQMIRTYLDWVLDVPWDKTDRGSARSGRGAPRPRRGPLRPRQGQGADRRVPRGAEAAAVAGRIRAASAAPARIRGPILCFVGPPGVGKTSLGQSIARAMNRKFVRISLGGVRDEAEIRGHRRTYIGSMPGRLVQALKTGRRRRTRC